MGQLVSALGSNISLVASPYLIYEVTHSTAKVGLLGVASLIPLVLFGFWGGAVADVGNRRRLILICEGLMMLNCAFFAYLVQSQRVNEIWIFVLTMVISALGGFHRPALEALTPRLVPRSELPKVSTLNGFRNTFSLIIGPAIGGLMISAGGMAFTYYADGVSFLFSMSCLFMIQNPPREGKTRDHADFKSVIEGFSYAARRPVLLGTYLVDIMAMTFCFPAALFPAIADLSGGAAKLGPLYSAISVGALLASIFSAWTYRVRRHGAMVSLGGFGWCAFILGFGAMFLFSYWFGLVMLACAGFCDMISAMFRHTIWNENIPDSYRGRLAGIEMISYMSGPLLGNTILGYTASVTSPQTALTIGGAVGLFGVSLATLWLRPFWRYQATERGGVKVSFSPSVAEHSP